MRPGVTGNLVTFSIHSADDAGPVLGGINGTLAKVVTSDKEGGLETIFRKLVKDLVGVNVRAVIIGNGHRAGGLARVDASSSVLDIALLRARIIASASSTRSLVAIASWTEVDQTIRSSAVIR